MNESFNISGLFFEAAEKNPEKTAIIYRNQQITFGELEKQVKETACYFMSKGITKGDRAMVFVPMSIDLYRIVLALFRIGATAVFLDEWVSKKRMEECCKTAQCKAFIGIFKARVLSFFSSELRKIPIHLGNRFQPYNAILDFAGTFKSDTALITYTTGSTGTPKAAKRTHGFLLEQFNALLETIKPAEDDIDMPVLPIVLLMNLGTGTPSVIAEFNSAKPAAFLPGKVISQIQQYGINRITASPFFLKILSRHMTEQKISLPGMRKIFTGGAPVFPAEAALYYKAFPQTNTEVVYGSTESEPVSSVNIKELIQEDKNILCSGLNVGKPAQCAEIKIIRIKDEPISLNKPEELSLLEMPAGDIGEIIVAGNHVLREYFNNEEALKRNKIFIEQKCWHRTGDSGYLGPDGKLYLTGRCSSLILHEGRIISPFIYEKLFQSLEGVETGTIVLLNQKIIAFIELNNNSKKEEVRKKVRQFHLAPDQLIFLKKIPRDPRHHSKIEYEKLKNFSLRQPLKSLLPALWLILCMIANRESHDPFQVSERRAYRGEAIAILKATAPEGKLQLKASAPGLKDGSVTIEVVKPVASVK